MKENLSVTGGIKSCSMSTVDTTGFGNDAPEIPREMRAQEASRVPELRDQREDSQGRQEEGLWEAEPEMLACISLNTGQKFKR